MEAVCSGAIDARTFIAFFKNASDVDKGTCADVMKHVSAQKPAILAKHIDLLVSHVNHRAPRVIWGVQEALGNLAAKYPGKAAKAVPNLLRNTVENRVNTTVIRWCAAYALAEITKHSSAARKDLVPKLRAIAGKEKNNGVRNVYLRALKSAG